MVEVCNGRIQVALLYLRGAEVVVRQKDIDSAVSNPVVVLSFGNAAVHIGFGKFRIELQSAIEVGDGTVLRRPY